MRALTVGSVGTVRIAGTIVLLAACTSGHERDCRELLPIVDAAHAEPSDENVAKLKSVYAKDKDLVDAVTAYAKPVARLNSGSKAVNQLVAAMKMKSDAGPAFSLAMFDKSRPHAERLLRLCMPTDAPPAPACAALSRALDSCISPVKDDTTAEEQLLTCANGFAAARADDPPTNEAIQALATTIRDFEPFTRNIGAPARDVVKAAKELLPKITDAQRAGAEANLAEIRIRSLCTPDRR